MGTRSDADTCAPTEEVAPKALPSPLRPGQLIARQVCKPLEEMIRGLDQQDEKKAEKKARHCRVAPESAVVNSGLWEPISHTPTTVAQETLNADDKEWGDRLQKRTSTIEMLMQSEKY